MSQGHNVGECIECGKPVNIYKREQMLAGMCNKCLEKDNKIPLEIYSTQELYRIAVNVVKNGSETILLQSLCEEIIKHNKTNKFLRGFSLVLPTEIIRCGLFGIKESDDSVKIHRTIMDGLKNVRN